MSLLPVRAARQPIRSTLHSTTEKPVRNEISDGQRGEESSSGQDQIDQLAKMVFDFGKSSGVAVVPGDLPNAVEFLVLRQTELASEPLFHFLDMAVLLFAPLAADFDFFFQQFLISE